MVQTNHEGVMVEQIQQAAEDCQGILINPAAYPYECGDPGMR